MDDDRRYCLQYLQLSGDRARPCWNVPSRYAEKPGPLHATRRFCMIVHLSCILYLCPMVFVSDCDSVLYWSHRCLMLVVLLPVEASSEVDRLEVPARGRVPVATSWRAPGGASWQRHTTLPHGDSHFR